MCVTRTPLDWFEITITIRLDITFYVKVGIFLNLGFVTIEFTVFEYRHTWSFFLLGPVKYQPEPFEVVADLDSEGTLELNEPETVCESKGGSMGNEGK